MFNPTATLQLPWHSVLGPAQSCSSSQNITLPFQRAAATAQPRTEPLETPGLCWDGFSAPQRPSHPSSTERPLSMPRDSEVTQGLRGTPGRAGTAPQQGGGCWVQKPGRHLHHPLTASSHLKKLRPERGGDASNHKRLSTGAGQTLPLGWVGWEALGAELNSKGIKATQSGHSVSISSVCPRGCKTMVEVGVFCTGLTQTQSLPQKHRLQTENQPKNQTLPCQTELPPDFTRRFRVPCAPSLENVAQISRSKAKANRGARPRPGRQSP